MSIGNRIKELRNEKELTQMELAGKIGYSNASISDWEHNEKQPTAQAIIRLCEYFEVSADYLLGISEDDKPVIFSKAPPPIPQAVTDILALCKNLDAIKLAQIKGFVQGIAKGQK